jgi:hypothetical protein
VQRARRRPGAQRVTDRAGFPREICHGFDDLKTVTADALVV